MNTNKDKEQVTVFILYWTNLALINEDDTLLSGYSNDGFTRLVRLEEVTLPKSENVLCKALDLAKPRDGEVVLNAVFA